MKDSIKYFGLGILYAYVAILLFLLFKDPEVATIYKSLFFFALCALSPFLAIGKAVYTIPAILFGLIAFYFIFTRVKGGLQATAFAAFLIGWEVYGVRCLVLLSGGA